MTDSKLDIQAQRGKVSQSSEQRCVVYRTHPATLFESTPRSICRKALSGVLFFAGIATGEMPYAR